MTIDRKLASKIWKAKHSEKSCAKAPGGIKICNSNYNDGSKRSWVVSNANSLTLNSTDEAAVLKLCKAANLVSNYVKPTKEKAKKVEVKKENNKKIKVAESVSDNKVEVSASASETIIQYRLDILHLTFLIEAQLEDKLKLIFADAKKVGYKELFNLIEKDKITQLLNTIKIKDGVAKEIQIVSSDGLNYDIDSFLNFSTFGETITLLIALEDNMILKHFGNMIDEIGVKALEQWYGIIKDFRNIVAHRNNIDPLNLYGTLDKPINTIGLDKFNIGNEQYKRNFIINYLLFDQVNNPKIKDILVKHKLAL